MLEPSNPFYHCFKLTARDIFWLFVAGPFLVPIRVFLVTLIILSIWLTANIGLLGLEQSHLESVPLSGWRRICQELFWSLSSDLLFALMGFKVRVVGQRANRSKAPVLVGAPHTSWLDPLIVSLCRASAVGREEQKRNPVTARCAELTQSIIVNRLGRP